LALMWTGVFQSRRILLLLWKTKRTKHTKNTNIGIFSKSLCIPVMEKFVIFYSHSELLRRPFGVFNGNGVYLVVIWYVFFHFGMLHQ
jgi:hypothetical protein